MLSWSRELEFGIVQGQEYIKGSMVWNGSLAADAMATVHPKRRAHLTTKLVEPLSASLTGLNVEVLCSNHLVTKAFSTLVTRANLFILIKEEAVGVEVVECHHHLAAKSVGN